MEPSYSSQEKEKIRREIGKKYAQAAKDPGGLFRYPTGRAGLEALRYDRDILSDLPEAVSSFYCGVGNPFSAGPVNEGDRVLDVGCGAGVDAIFAAKAAGPGGTVVGVDAVSGMLRRAGQNLSRVNLQNVHLAEATAEELPLAGEAFDAVISNGVFNLVPDKAKAASEAFRVTRRAGRLLIADQVLVGELPEDRQQILESWSR